MNLSDRKKLAQLSRRLKAAIARYKSLEKRAHAFEAKRVAQAEKANRLVNLLYSKKGQGAGAARQKSVTAQFVKANKEAERLQRQESKVYEALRPVEEKIATLKENMRKVQAKKNPEKKTSKGKTALRATGRALKGATRGILAAGSQILGAGATALNPKRKKAVKKPKRKNKTIIKAKRVLIKRVCNPKRKTATKGKRTIARAKKAKATRNASRVIRTRKAAKSSRRISSSSRKPATTGSKKRVASTRKRKANPSPESIRKEFAGRHTKDSRLYFPDGTPQGLAKLGKIVLIKTKSGPIELVNRKGEVWLCVDTNKRFHLGSTINAPLFDGARNFGEVKEIEYQESKPHLGYTKKIIWFHHMGEEGGKRPELTSNSKGELRFKGGDYRITTRGIEN
jgi:hypothetical protein